jgi:hypothetical protein
MQPYTPVTIPILSHACDLWTSTSRLFAQMARTSSLSINCMVLPAKRNIQSQVMYWPYSIPETRHADADFRELIAMSTTQLNLLGPFKDIGFRPLTSPNCSLVDFRPGNSHLHKHLKEQSSPHEASRTIVHRRIISPSLYKLHSCIGYSWMPYSRPNPVGISPP